MLRTIIMTIKNASTMLKKMCQSLLTALIWILDTDFLLLCSSLYLASIQTLYTSIICLEHLHCGFIVSWFLFSVLPSTIVIQPKKRDITKTSIVCYVSIFNFQSSCLNQVHLTDNCITRVKQLQKVSLHLHFVWIL